MQNRQEQAFTLVELLVVLAIISIVSAFVFGMGHRANNFANTAIAKAELSGIAAALESYRRQCGDYPRTAEPEELLQSLIGKRGPTGETLATRPFLALAGFRRVTGDPFTGSVAQLLDPWGNPYAYAYRSALPWTASSYVLYSRGEDGAAAPLLPGGFIDREAAINRDNVYALP